jgi:hypothetical protein
MSRPSDYKPEYCDKLIQHMSTGHSFESFGAVVGCGRRTLFDWAEKHEEFKEAKKQAEEKALKFFEDRLAGKLAGVEVKGFDPKKVDTTLLIFAMKTRFHKIYGDRLKHEIEDEDELEFN